MNSFYLIFSILLLNRVNSNPVSELTIDTINESSPSSIEEVTTESIGIISEDIESSGAIDVTTSIDESLPSDCSHCLSAKYLNHYYAKGCKPIFDDRCKDCPKSFDCNQKEEVLIGSNECLVNGLKYRVGEAVPMADPCKVCQCGFGFTHTYSAFSTPFTTVHCITLECPEHFGVHRFPLAGFEREFERIQNCYGIYQPNKCCAVEKKCLDSEKTSDDKLCEYNDKNYRIGEKFYPIEDKCKVCICDQNWDPNSKQNNTGCYDLKCSLEIERKLRDGCTPIYHENTCCPIDYYCPETSFEVEITKCSQPLDVGPCVGAFKRFYYEARDGQCHSFAYSGCGGNDNNFRSVEECEQTCSRLTHHQNETTPEESSYPTKDSDNYCIVNDNKYEIGAKLDIGQKCVDCECHIPPEFTCIQRSCPSPPSDECRVSYSPYDCCPIFDCSYNKTNDLPFDPLSCATPLCEKGCLFETYPDRCPNCVCPKTQDVPDYDLSDI